MPPQPGADIDRHRRGSGDFNDRRRRNRRRRAGASSRRRSPSPAPLCWPCLHRSPANASSWGPSQGSVSRPQPQGFAWIIVGIWIELDGGWVWRVPTTLIVTATAVAVAALLAFAKLEHGQRWVLTAARLGAGVVAAMIIIGIWGESVTGRLLGESSGSSPFCLQPLSQPLRSFTARLVRIPASLVSVRSAAPTTKPPTGTMTTCPMSHDTYRVIV